MNILITNPINFEFPASILGWLGWGVFLGLLILFNIRFKELNQPLVVWRKRTSLFLLILIPLTVLALPSLQVGSTYARSAIPVFAAIPWFFGAGLLGPGLASILGFLSGTLIWMWGGNDFILPISTSLLAAIMGWMFFQNYRTPFFRALRHPIFAALVLILLFPVLFFVGVIILGEDSIASRIEYGFDLIIPAFIGFGLAFLVAGLVGEFGYIYLRPYWGSQRANQPSPGESKLSGRFLFIVAPLSVILLIVLIVGDWLVASKAAREMLEGRMANAGNMTAQSIPFFLENGQNLLISLAELTSIDQSPEQIQERLATQRRDLPYFSQLIYLDPQGNFIAGDPGDAIQSLPLTADELDQIGIASIVPIDIVAIRPEPGRSTAWLSFIAGVRDSEGDLKGVLVGRSDLAENPFARPLLTSIDSLAEVDGQGMLVDENGLILYHPDASKVMTPYTGKVGEEPQFFEEISHDGESELVYFRTVIGRPWSVIITVPGEYAQRQAVNIALPLLGIISILAISAFFIFRYGLRSVTSSLQDLAVQADRMSQGELELALSPGGEDEVGQLRGALDKMRGSLKSRLDELNRLLFISQGIASSLDLEDSLGPVLEAASLTGASSTRVYLLPALTPSSSGEKFSAYCIGLGPMTDAYAHLDEQVTGLVEKRDILKLNNLTRPRIFSISEETTLPQAILAVPIRQENQFFGALWLAFDNPHQFAEEEVKFIVTLGGQAALAASNARLFLSAEIGRQMLESIIDSTPDPVIVTDHENNILVTNPAAEQVFGLYDGDHIGKHISEHISQDEVLSFFLPEDIPQERREVTFENGKTYFVTTSVVEVGGKGLGRVCILRDITSFKDLDSSKSEFVSTVSHDLRSPLALIQGYTAMLKMVGELNDQQSSYLEKISFSTERMSHLVTNLLDLGRIEAGVGLHLEKKTAGDVILRVVDAAQVQADQKRINLNTEFNLPNLPLVEADQDLLQQALYNLVDNAIKFTEPGGDVWISVLVENDNVTYQVKDTGIGISPADQQKLFDKFFRVSNKSGLNDGGSGLGLAIVKSIAERHGGQVYVRSQLGVGSTFSFEIPLKQEPFKN